MFQKWWISGLVATMVATGAAGAQTPAAPPAGAPPPDFEKVQQEIRDAQEDLVLLRVLSAMKITPAQLAKLLPTLEAAQVKLAEQDKKDAAALKARESALEAAKKTVANGAVALTPAEDQYRRTQQTLQLERTKLRALLVAAVRRAMVGVLTKDQLASMVGVGRDMRFIQRQADWIAEASTGTGGGGPLGGMTRMMDRMRSIPPAEWDKQKAQMAAGGGGGGGGIFGFGGGDRGGRGGDRGGDRGGRGGPGGPGGGNAAPQSAEDAARQQRMQAMQQQRMQQMMKMAEQVRVMPSDQYASQKYNLASQQMRSMMSGFGGQDENPEESANRFVDRYLLSPRAVIVVREKMSSPTAAR